MASLARVFPYRACKNPSLLHWCLQFVGIQWFRGEGFSFSLSFTKVHRQFFYPIFTDVGGGEILH